MEKLDPNIVTQLRELFNQIDDDNSGVLEFNEFVELLKKCGIECTDEQAKSIMESIDENSDGKIDFREFCELYYKAMNCEEE